MNSNGKGNTRRPENDEAVTRNWPFDPPGRPPQHAYALVDKESGQILVRSLREKRREVRELRTEIERQSSTAMTHLRVERIKLRRMDA